MCSEGDTSSEAIEEARRAQGTEPRSHAEIFADLRVLAQSPGSLHGISAIVYRDWVLTIDTQEARVIDDPEHRWSTSKLNKNELLLLLGLAVQSPSDRTFSVEAVDNTFGESVDRLLREFHDRVLMDCAPALDQDSKKLIARPESIGLIAREAIYYGADSMFLHQIPHFSRLRYRDDAAWLLQNVGLSIRPMIEIARFIAARINDQMTAVGQMRKEGYVFSHGDLTNSLLIAKADVRKTFGQKADAFFAKFTTQSNRANANFVDPFAINDVAIAPIIDLGDYLYVPSQMTLRDDL